jgi:hypothetical protein
MSHHTITRPPAIRRVSRHATGHGRSAVRTAVTAGVITLACVGCGGAGNLSTSATAGPSTASRTSPAAPSVAPSTSVAPVDSVPPSTAPEPSQGPDTGGGTTSGDVPDNAVFLTYHQAKLGFSIQYVEGWQVATRPDGVLIKDKDSSETVTVVMAPNDVAAYITSTDLPALQSQAGFKLLKQDSVKVGGTELNHLVFHILSPADPVTGKQVPATVDRYYVPGSGQLAVVSLSTPDGVDNVDAFRQMITSFAWK